jgi:hypothetical protein
MRTCLDVAALNAGLVFTGLAGLALWSAFGTVSWPVVSVAAPLALVAIGLLGLLLSRNPERKRKEHHP